MSYPEIRLGDTHDFKFTSRAPTGQPTTLLGSPALVALLNNGATEITAGITLTVDFNGRTGLNHVRIAATSGNGFSSDANVQIVLSAGTVAGVPVAGEVVGEFTIEKTNVLEVTDNLLRASRCVTHGVVDVGATTTSIPTKSLSPAAVHNNQFQGEILGFSEDTATAGLRGQKTRVESNTNTGVFTVEALTTAPAEDDIFVIE